MSTIVPKILMITPFNRQQRGNSLTSARLKKGLESRGFNIELLSLEESNARTQLRARLKTEQYSLVHAFHARHLAAILEENPVLQNYPLILTTTGTDINFDMFGADKSNLEKAFRAADRIVVFHDDFVTQIARSYSDLEHKLTAIPQGIYLPEAPSAKPQQITAADNTFVFLLPSGLRPVKNIALSIDALEKIQPEHPELRLLIVGAIIDSDYSQTILERIRNLEWVNYIGEIPHEHMGSLIRQANVVINSSQAEGQPQAVLEAMSLAKPCIMTAVPGNLHIIEHGREGFYIANAADFAEIARVMIKNPKLCQEMGQAAQQLVEKNFSLTRELDAYTALYQALYRGRFSCPT